LADNPDLHDKNTCHYPQSIQTKSIKMQNNSNNNKDNSQHYKKKYNYRQHITKKRKRHFDNESSSQASHEYTNEELRKQASLYQSTFLRLVELEKKEEMDQFYHRLQHLSDEQLMNQGIVLFSMYLQMKGQFYDKTRVIATRNRKQTLPFHRFINGDMVVISRKHPLQDTMQFKADVLELNNREIVFVFSKDNLPRDIHNGTWRIDKACNTVAYDRMNIAVKSILRNPELVPIIDEEDNSYRNKKGDRKSDPEQLTCGSYVSDIIIETFNSSDTNLLNLNSRLTEGTVREQASIMNESQKLAIQTCLNNRFSLIQGPPGTGKTTVTIEFIKIAKQLNIGPILVTAYTNIAVDNILEGLLNNGIHALRVGSPVKVTDKLRRATLIAKIEEHPMNEEVTSMIQTYYNMRSELPKLRGRDIGLQHRDLARQKRSIQQKKLDLINSILAEHDIVVATCIGSGTDILENVRFPLVVIDECTQCLEPGSLVPILKGSKHVVLVGDHYQLPPTTLSSVVEKEGLNRSLFERLSQFIQPVMLTEQYRMHPSIATFPSNQFYNGKVKSSEKLSQERPPITGIVWPNQEIPHIAFYDYSDNNCEKSGNSIAGKSKMNPLEVNFIIKVLKNILLQSGLQSDQIGIISPYSLQVQQIENAIRTEWEDTQGIEVKTVDGFQGREKELIVISCVRCNSEGNIGFLSDWRRLNVAITRPRRGLILIGHSKTLQNDSNWKEYLQWLKTNKLLLNTNDIKF
jgi:hypothetical protein